MVSYALPSLSQAPAVGPQETFEPSRVVNGALTLHLGEAAPGAGLRNWWSEKRGLRLHGPFSFPFWKCLFLLLLGP